MLTIEDIFWAEEMLKKVTYKPGWTIEPYAPHGSYDDFGIRIEFKAEDTRNPGRTARVTARERIPEFVIVRRDPKRFFIAVQEALFKVERHESQEWFWVDGQIFDDPHKERV